MKRTYLVAALCATLSLFAQPVFAAPVAAPAVYKLALNTPTVDLPSVALNYDLGHDLRQELQTQPALLSFSASAAPAHGTTIFGLPLNMGPIDRILRGVIAAGLIGTGIYGLSSNAISAPISWTLIGVATIPTATAATGYCPLYQLFGLEYSF